MNEIKDLARGAIERRRQAVIDVGDRILHMPELGFKEYRTAGVAKEFLESLGLAVRDRIALTGLKAILDTGRPGPTVAVMGELDALVVAGHPLADPETGAAPACGHNGQIAGMLAAAIGLSDPAVLAGLCGRIVFIAVPAEEYVEVEYRHELVRNGRLHFLGGKPELVALDELADVDIGMMVHLAPMEHRAGVAESNNGCVVKMIRYLGKASHAGGAPHDGVNALNAANLGMQAIHAQRETFRDEDAIRVHPIITRGGDIVNVVPAEVTMETYVRGKTLEAIFDAERKVDRALKAGAMAVGATVEIETLPGYMPLQNHAELGDLFMANVAGMFGPESVKRDGHRAGSTDMGDLSHLMPTIHPYMNGITGAGHSVDWTVTDQGAAYVDPGIAMAMTTIDLLGNGGKQGERIVNEFRAPLSRDEYLEVQRAVFRKDVFGPE